MNHQKNEQSTTDASRAETIESIQASKPTAVETSLKPMTPVVKMKRWQFASLIVLMSLGVIAIIVYLPRSELAYNGRYEGLVIALCAITCGGFLVRRLIRELAEEDELQDQQLNANQATVSPSESTPAVHEINQTTPPPEVGQNVK